MYIILAVGSTLALNKLLDHLNAMPQSPRLTWIPIIRKIIPFIAVASSKPLQIGLWIALVVILMYHLV
jgi:hypothetical protein